MLKVAVIRNKVAVIWNKVEIKIQNYEKYEFMKIGRIMRFKVAIFDVAIMTFCEIVNYEK